MRPALDLLTQYAAHHRDRRNITGQFVGVPLIVFAVGLLLARPALEISGIELTPAWIVFAGLVIWYLTRGAFALGAAVSLATGVLLLLAHRVAGGGVWSWLGWGVGCFGLGWLIQFVGHWYEDKKPAFVDDLSSLVVGPMFVTAEAMFALGWNAPMLHQIEQRVGPTTMRDLAKIA